LAERHGIAFYPFFLDGVALDPALNQSDGIHPNAAGARRIARNIAPSVIALIESLERPVQRVDGAAPED
jgi:acyl-CoA thioesterase-1